MIEQSKTYGCFYCFQQNIAATDIQEYTGDSNPEPICPYCGIDSLSLDVDMNTLLYRHVMSFHVGSIIDNKGVTRKSLLSCPHLRCLAWNSFLASNNNNS